MTMTMTSSYQQYLVDLSQCLEGSYQHEIEITIHCSTQHQQQQLLIRPLLYGFVHSVSVRPQLEEFHTDRINSLTPKTNLTGDCQVSSHETGNEQQLPTTTEGYSHIKLSH